MGKWRALFESNLPPVGEREDRAEYEFGPPAAPAQLAAAEAALGVPLPADVREMLSEFNGVWRTATYPDGRRSRKALYLDVDALSVAVPEYFDDCGNDLPDPGDLRRVVFVAQSNGFADLWGVCAEAVAGHEAGAVVTLDHEGGGLGASHPSLAAFVADGRK